MRSTQVGVLTLAAALGAAVAQIGQAQDPPTVETTVYARAMQPGEVVRLDVTCACGPAEPRVTAFGSSVALVPLAGARGWRGLIGIDVEAEPGVYPISITVDRPEQPPLTTTRSLHVIAKRFPTRRLRVAAGFVNPPASALERIAREAEQMRALFGIVTPHPWDGEFQLPVAEKAARNFGARSFFNGQPRSPHSGVDFHAPAGTPVAAPAAGSIALAEPLFFTGNTVIIDHGLGLYSLMAHLSMFGVAKGDRVPRGAIVGLVGATGRVTGPHLHWAMRLNGARVDPLSVLAAVAAVPAP